jgi:hypothetical protein
MRGVKHNMQTTAKKIVNRWVRKLYHLPLLNHPSYPWPRKNFCVGA